MKRDRSERSRYTHYSIEIIGYDDERCHSSTLPGNMSVSSAVERFLQDFLKNDKIRVKIESHETEVREI